MSLEFFFLVNKHQKSYEDVFSRTVSQAAKLGVNIFQKIVSTVF
jgi:hypothetical protein